nr:hypothetical protein [Tanacetum cinerariifolium]
TRLANVGHSKWLVAWPNQKREVLEASGCVFFHTREPKKFCQFIKGVKLPDGFESCFKNKVTDNYTNITGLKSHDCHIMMQRLLSYGLQNYLPDKIAKPIIELCSLFKQICSATLMEDDILKAQIKVVDILCDLELIYPPALFDIMIHLVIHLPLEALEGGPIRPRSHYFRDVTTKFNRPGRNVDPPPPTCQFQVFRLWFDTRNHGPKVKRLVLKNNMTQIDTRAESFKDDQCILVTQVKQVFYLEDIIDVVDEDDDITDDEDTLPHDLADFDNEDLINVDDDGVDKMSADVARSYGGDGGGEDRLLHTMHPAVAWVALLTEIRRARPENITASEWDKYIQFWNDPKNISLAAQNRQNRAKSTVISRQGSRSLARLRDEMRQSSTTQEYPSLIDTFFVAHTVNREFLRDEDRQEMRRLEATGTYTDDEINRLDRGGKHRGHIPGVGKVLPTRATASPSTPAHESTLNSLHKKVDFMMSLFKSNSKYSDMFSQFESGGASGSGGCVDYEEGVDHQDDEDEDGDGDT